LSQRDLSDLTTENKNYRYDAEKNIFYFKRCPRTFLKTDMPAKRPNKWCPLRSMYWNDTEGRHRCSGPTAINYVAERIPKDKLMGCSIVCFKREANP